MKLVKFFFVLLLAFVFMFSGYAQREVKLFLSPATAMCPNFSPAIQPGIEWKADNHFGLLGEFAVPYNAYKDSNALHPKFLRSRIGLRYHFNGYNPFYVGMSFAYTKRSFDNLKSGSFNQLGEPDSVRYNFKSAHINSPFSSITIDAGFTGILYKKIGIELFGGLGLRTTNTSYSSLVELQKVTYFEGVKCGFVIPRTWQTSGKVNGIQLNLGVRLFYTLK